jgi:hypothetical protein
VLFPTASWERIELMVARWSPVFAQAWRGLRFVPASPLHGVAQTEPLRFCPRCRSLGEYDTATNAVSPMNTSATTIPAAGRASPQTVYVPAPQNDSDSEASTTDTDMI